MNTTIVHHTGGKPEVQDGPFIVRQGALAVRFEITLTAKSVYEVVADQDATTFSTRGEADDMARKFGIRMGQFTICPFAG